MTQVRMSAAQRQARRRARAFEAGICGRCFTARRIEGRKSCAACYAQSVEQIRATGLRRGCEPEKGRGKKRMTSPSSAENKRATRPAIPSRSDDEIEALLSAKPDITHRLRHSLARDDDDEPEVSVERGPLDL